MRGVKTRAGSRWKKLLLSLVLTILLAVLLNSVFNVYKKKKAAEEVLARMQSEVTTLEERQRFLNDSLSRLSTKEGLKFEIRKKLNVAEVGEKVAIIVTDESTTSAVDVKISWWQKFKNFWQSF